jgi:hypothetical protein
MAASPHDSFYVDLWLGVHPATKVVVEYQCASPALGAEIVGSADKGKGAETWLFSHAEAIFET